MLAGWLWVVNGAPGVFVGRSVHNIYIFLYLIIHFLPIHRYSVNAAISACLSNGRHIVDGDGAWTRIKHSTWLLKRLKYRQFDDFFCSMIDSRSHRIAFALMKFESRSPPSNLDKIERHADFHIIQMTFDFVSFLYNLISLRPTPSPHILTEYINK